MQDSAVSADRSQTGYFGLRMAHEKKLSEFLPVHERECVESFSRPDPRAPWVPIEGFHEGYSLTGVHSMSPAPIDPTGVRSAMISAWEKQRDGFERRIVLEFIPMIIDRESFNLVQEFILAHDLEMDKCESGVEIRSAPMAALQRKLDAIRRQEAFEARKATMAQLRARRAAVAARSR